MCKIPPIKTTAIKKLLKHYGYELVSQRGSHITYKKPFGSLPLVIIEDKETKPYKSKEVAEHLKLSKREFMDKIREL